MTHRSRSGGPQKQRNKRNNKNQPKKLHHPPAPPKDIEEEDTETTIPSSAFIESPTNTEILELVHHALKTCLDATDFTTTVKRFKGLLYDKKWLDVFTDDQLLESYAGRWVPSRGCCYRELFAHLGTIRKLFVIQEDQIGSDGEEDDDEEEEQQQESEAGPSNQPMEEQTETKILSLGGGASSELLAIAALIKSSLELGSKTLQDRKGKSPVKWNWTGIDIGSWSKVVKKFQTGLSSQWELDDSVLNIDFIQGDLLKSSQDEDETESDFQPIDLSSILLQQQPDLTTILFTLTELMSQSRAGTINLLRSLSQIPKGGLLLIADSASDISEFEMGSSGRKWPIYMILDMMLLGPPGQEERKGDWECVRKEDSRWFRLPVGVGAGWPVKLENTRYWYHLYRRI